MAQIRKEAWRWSDSGYIVKIKYLVLKIKSSGFEDNLDMWCEEKRSYTPRRRALQSTEGR